MFLKKRPDWDFKEKYVWFEIQLHDDVVLCRIDSSCFLSSLGTLGAGYASPVTCRRAFERDRERILAVACAQANAGHLEAMASDLRKFVWIRDKHFASIAN
jgi:hypothetical protein